ncbi:MAG: hypothetical protein ACI4D0_10630 [Lachnospira sp.]
MILIGIMSAKADQMMKLLFIGGGARIIEAYGSYNKDRVFFNHDIRSNAKGYE